VATQHAPTPGADGSSIELDDARWRVLREAVVAAHQGDGRAFHAALLKLANHVPYDGLPAASIWWLLRYRVAQLLGRRPSRGDITQIAGYYTETRFGAVIQDVSLLQDVLLTVWKLASAEREVVGGQFLVAGAAALGALLHDPGTAMDDARPDLTAWCQRNLDHFQMQGLLQDRSRPAKP
jgi:hypothetical protein